MKERSKLPLMDEEMIQQEILLLEQEEKRDFSEVKDIILRGSLLLEQERIRNLTKKEKMILKGRLLIEQERIRNLTKKEKMILKGRVLREDDQMYSLTKEDQMLYTGKLSSRKEVIQKNDGIHESNKHESVIHRGKLLLDKEQKDERTDRVTIPNQMGELVLPIAHYALIDSKNPRTSNLKILIYGLGSCIALILFDRIAKVSAMSHIYLPKSSVGYFEDNFPQKHADTAVMDLLNQMIENGAKKENIKACVFGGSTIFINAISDMGERNSESVKNELKSLHIKIEKEFIGGRKGSTIIYDVKNNLILLSNLNKKIRI